MTAKYLKICLAGIIFLAVGNFTSATVDWEIIDSLKIDAVPLDVAVSADGKYIFVLTDQGTLLIYTSNGVLDDKIDVGAHIDQITLGPDGEQLFATSRKNKTLEVIKLDFIHQIDTSGSPYKGSEQAQVVIAVFSDFQ